MKIADTGDIWWKTAVIYCLDVENFLDVDGDGVGDFGGLTDKIDYLADLGVTCIWLMPFYPTPDADDGYDVSDFYGVDPRLGSHGDVVEFVRTARSRGIRVIIDLVVNHTSDRHPWFINARRSRSARYRDYYVWRDRPTRKQKNEVFPGEEESIWEWDERTGQYYLHSFYKHQPDLNIANPAVRDEIAKVMAFWLTIGVSGFRMDAVPFLLESPGGPYETDPHEFLRDVKRFARRRSSEAMLLGEVALPHEQQADYYGENAGELDSQFDFTTMQAVYLSMVREEASPIVDALTTRPPINEPVSWVNMLRNHDELTLALLSEKEKNEVLDALAPDPAQRAYGRGILRRLAPMLQGDMRRIRLAYSLMFSLPGNPLLFYGEELGMGENAEIAGRMAVRTPMQWTPGKNAGFSDARPSQLIAPLPGGGYAPVHVNALDQQKEPDSLFHFVRDLAHRYRSLPEIGWGDLDLVQAGPGGAFVHSLATPSARFVAAHNLSSEPVQLEVNLPDSVEGDVVLSDLLSPGYLDVKDDRSCSFELDAYGFQWFRVVPREKLG
jgi:trehalose synthase